MTGKLRIALILSELRPGGMERVVVQLANGLKARGLPTLVICLQNEGPLAEELRANGGSVVALRSLKGKDLKAVWALGKVLKEFNPTVINLHDFTSIPYAVIANILTMKRLPIILTAHGMLYGGFEELKIRYRFFSKWLSMLTAVSKPAADRNREYLNWTGPTILIPNGVPVRTRDEILRTMKRQELGIGPECFFFLSVGNPRPEKGYEDLIRATEYLVQRRPQKKFVVFVAGNFSKEDEYCKMLDELLEAKGLEGTFRFLGFQKDTLSLYSAADAFVLSSRSEGLPMVILEAMMMGLPIISTNVGGIPDAVKDVGLLVPPSNPHKIAEAMYVVLSDEDYAKNLGKRARRHCMSKFTIDTMVENYIKCYHTTCKE